MEIFYKMKIKYAIKFFILFKNFFYSLFD